MVPDRLELARLSYVRALELARARSTPTSWARLLAASKNLRAARHAMRPPRARPHRPPPDETAARAAHRRAAARRWPELEKELVRARRLIAEARELCAHAQALRASLLRLRG